MELKTNTPGEKTNAPAPKTGVPAPKTSILEQIKTSNDVKKLSIEELERLNSEIRAFLVENVSRTGGHLASNLGVVELTTALYKVFDFPSDKIVWDVGHQSYVHKILSGRKDGFGTLRKMGGLSGFPKSAESEYDPFNTGHSSTAISAAIGIARARDLNKGGYKVIAVVGDGALTGGMCYEALNDAGRSTNNLTVILNDNEMSIGKNVGGISRHLNKIRTKPAYFILRDDINRKIRRIPIIGVKVANLISSLKSKIKYSLLPGVIFEELGFKYIGPVDGHDVKALVGIFEGVSLMAGPVLVHVKTKKGHGYSLAENNPQEYHGVGPFEPKTGDGAISDRMTYSLFFGNKLTKLANKDKDIVAITAAMRSGVGFDKFAEAFPDRFFDVGIAEQHAVTMAAGMATEGVKPVVAIYSSFLQRAYDQILHDVCLQNLHVVFAIDRAGIVGEDGETHQGAYDIAFLRHMPNITIMAPSDHIELARMLEEAIYKIDGPVAIRYPKGFVSSGVNRNVRRHRVRTSFSSKAQQIEYGKSEYIAKGADVTVIAVGTMLEEAVAAAEAVKALGIYSEVINARFVKPIDSDGILKSVKKTGKLLIVEDGCIAGGYGGAVLEFLNKKGVDFAVDMCGLPDMPIPHGGRRELLENYGLSKTEIANRIVILATKGWALLPSALSKK